MCQFFGGASQCHLASGGWGTMSEDTGGSARVGNPEKKGGFIFMQVIVFEVMRPLSCAQFGDSVFGVGIEHLSQELCGYRTGVSGLGLGRSQFSD